MKKELLQMEQTTMRSFLQVKQEMGLIQAELEILREGKEAGAKEKIGQLELAITQLEDSFSKIQEEQRETLMMIKELAKLSKKEMKKPSRTVRKTTRQRR